MNDTLPTYAERRDDAVARIDAALDPQDEQEWAALTQLHRCVGDLPTLETLARLAERAANIARAEGYERGWAEGLEHARSAH